MICLKKYWLSIISYQSLCFRLITFLSFLKTDCSFFSPIALNYVLIETDLFFFILLPPLPPCRVISGSTDEPFSWC